MRSRRAGTFPLSLQILTDRGYPIGDTMLRIRHLKSSRLPAAAAAAVAVLRGVAGSASAATAPTAITGPVTTVGPTTATLSGTVNPNGSATSWQFEYGKTTTYGTSTAATNAGAGTANTGVSANLTGLTAGTSYHYRLVATSTAGGTADGADGIFTTSASPDAVTAAATGIGATSATLNGSLNPNGRSTTYLFEYGKTTSYGSKTAAVDAGGGDDPDERLGRRLRAHERAGLPLPARRNERRRVGPGRRHDLHAKPGPGGDDQGSEFGFFDGREPERLGRRARTRDDLLLRLRHLDELRLQDGGRERRDGNVEQERLGHGDGTRPGDLPLPARGHELRRHLGRSRPHVRQRRAPVVQTGSAQGASTTGVTLTGSVNPNGAVTNWFFEYGTSASYGTKIAAKSAGSGTAATGVSAAITKLTAGSTYHYRLVASSSSGTTNGGDVTFTTVAALTLGASTNQAVYGTTVTLSGAVWSRQTGVKITIYGQQIGATTFSTLGTVLTGAGGAWSFPVRPKIQTSYRADAPDGTSSASTVGVRPAVSLRIITGARFSSRVVGGSSFVGKMVQFQRLLPGNRWKTLAKARLNAKSSAVFSTASLPKGTSEVRVAMSVNQAGRGYLGRSAARPPTTAPEPGAPRQPWARTAALIASAVLAPTTPSAVRLFAFWNAVTALAVPGPKFPSTVSFAMPRATSACWRLFTCAPVSPDFR